VLTATPRQWKGGILTPAYRIETLEAIAKTFGTGVKVRGSTPHDKSFNDSVAMWPLLGKSVK